MRSLKYRNADDDEVTIKVEWPAQYNMTPPPEVVLDGVTYFFVELIP